MILISAFLEFQLIFPFGNPSYFYNVNTVEPFAFIITFLLGGVILTGVFVMFIILKSRDLEISRYFLITAMLGLTQHLVTYLLFTTQLIREWPILFGLGYPLLFLVGPGFYLFITSYGDHKFRLRNRDALHLIPFLVILVFYIPYIIGTTESKIALIEYYYNVVPNGPVSVGLWLQFSVHLVLLLLYSMASWIYLRKHAKRNATLLKRITILLLILALAEIVLQTGFLLTGTAVITAEIILAGLMSLAVLMLGFWIVDMKQVLPVFQDKKYRTSPLSSDRAYHIKSEIQEYLENEKPYLNPDLKIADLAKALGIPSHHISQVLGEELNTNFYDIINRYRVSKAKELLQSDLLSKISIQAIGQECGFNSKTSFYRAFKKSTDMTPMQFVEQQH